VARNQSLRVCILLLMREETLAAKIYRDRPGLALELGATSCPHSPLTCLPSSKSAGHTVATRSPAMNSCGTFSFANRSLCPDIMESFWCNKVPIYAPSIDWMRRVLWRPRPKQQPPNFFQTPNILQQMPLSQIHMKQ